MADELINKIGFDVTGAKTAINELEKALAGYNLQVDNLVKAEKLMTASGKATEVQLTFIGKAGQRLVTVLENINGKGGIQTKNTFTQLNDIFRDQQKLMKSVEAETANYERSLKSANTQLKNLTKSGQIWQQQQEDKTMRAIARETANFDKALAGANRQLAALAVSGQKAQLREENAAMRTIARETKAYEKSLEGANRQLEKLVKSGAKAELKEENAAMRSIARETKSYEKALEGANRQLGKLLISGQQIQRQQINSSKGQIVVSSLRTQTPTNLAVDNLQNVEKIIGSINNLFARGKITIADYLRVQQAVATNLTAQLTPAQQQLAQKLQALKAAYTATGAAGKTAGERITLTWAGVFRLFLVQTLHQAVSRLTFEFLNSTRAATEYGIKIAEIETISLRGGKNFRDWSNEVRALSDSFGQTTQSVQEGIYQALSNQVINAGESVQFLTTALNFSLAAVTSTENSVNLLSSGLKSFRLDVSESERVAAIMFKTIELGRVRADEMANTLGRVGALAHSLGVSLEEVGASIAVLTVQGINFSEAETLINNVMLKLIKPTDEMKELFKEWGVASGQAAIATFGFNGVLGKLDQEAAKGSERLGEIFNEMRALRGIIGLTGDAFKDFDAVLEKITTGSMADYKQAIDKIINNDAKKLQIEFNKVRNFFTVDIGQTMISALQNVITNFGSLVDIVKRVLITVGSLSTGFIAYKFVQSGIIQGILSATVAFGRMSFTLLTLRANAFTASRALLALRGVFAAVGGPIGLISIGVGLIAERFLTASFRAVDFKNASANALAELAPIYEEFNKKRLEESQELTKTQLEQLQIYKKGFLQYSADIQVIANKLITHLEEANKESLNNFKSFLDLLNDQLRDALRDTENRIREIESLIQDSQKRLKTVQEEAPQKSFDRSVNAQVDPSAQARLIQDEIKRIEVEIQKIIALGAGANVEALKDAESLAQRQIELAERVAQIRISQTKAISKEEEANEKKRAAASITTSNKAIRQLEEELKLANKIRLGGGLTPTQVVANDRRIRDLEARRDREKALLDEATKIAKGQVDLTKQREEAEKAITASIANQITLLQTITKISQDQLAKEQATLEAKKLAQNEFNKSSDNFLKFEIKVDNTKDADVSVQKQKEELEALKQNLIKQAEAVGVSDERLFELKSKIKDRIAAIENKANAELLAIKKQQADQELEQLNKKAVDDLQAQQKAHDDLLKEQSGFFLKSEQALKAFLENIKGLNLTTTEFFGDVSVTTDRSKDIIKQITLIQSAIDLFKATGDSNQVKNAIEQYNKILKSLTSLQTGGVLSSGPTKDQREELIAGLTSIISTFNIAATKAKEIEASAAKLATVQGTFAQIIAEIQLLSNAESAAGGTNAIVNIDMRNELELTRQKVADLAIEYQNLAVAIQSLGAAFGIVRGQKVQGGSIPYFASGGMVKKGFDTQMIAAAPGEFMMNRQATIKNYTQFVALNQGRQPRNFAQGGSVQTIGDINITVQGGDTAPQTIQQIGKGLQREIRSNRFKFRGQ